MDDEAVLQFIDFTGGSIESAQNYLAVSDGNLERAIALYHENGGADLGVSLESAQDQQRRQAEAAAARSSAQPFEDDDFSFNALDDGEVRKPIAQKHDVLVGGGDYYTDHVHHRDDYHDSAAMYGRGGEGSSGSSSRSGNRRTRNEDALRSAFTEAAASKDASEKANRLARLFETPTDIMFMGDFDSAREFARADEKWLMVTVSDSTEFACEVMKRDVWRIPEVKTLIRENFIFLFYASTSVDGAHHRNFYPFDSYPYVAIIDPRTGERVKIWSAVLSDQEFIQDVSEFLEFNSLHEPQPKKKGKAKSSSSLIDLTEEEQLEYVLAQSMGGADVFLDDEVEEEKAVDVWSTINAVAGDEPTSGDLTRIQFRLPDGSRVVRKFEKSQTVRSLFEFVKSLPGMDKKFEILNFRDALFPQLDSSLVDAKVVNTSVNVDFIEM